MVVDAFFFFFYSMLKFPNIKPIMLIALYLLCSPFTYCKWVGHITNLFSLLLMITLATHFCAQDNLQLH